jgi:Cytochrome bd terminal oxidase subunit I
LTTHVSQGVSGGHEGKGVPSPAMTCPFRSRVMLSAPITIPLSGQLTRSLPSLVFTVITSPQRRAAPAGSGGRFRPVLGLLCLKRNGTGYCSDEGSAAACNALQPLSQHSQAGYPCRRQWARNSPPNPEHYQAVYPRWSEEADHDVCQPSGPACRRPGQQGGGPGSGADGDHARVPYHLACLGIALPSVVLLAEFIGLRRRDETALRLARRWSQAMAVLIAVGAVTGTVLSFELGLLWPGLMRRYGAVLGFPFGVEGVFFFLEAI